ncbi:hypothetical protein RCL_jg782.t1 [Rhizophagus clarus]|uniref:Uncharacterized protein n=1 Tax=Rhizophagus clarus TaxID=94130 RepID=A0A8H3LCJ1_9GLOM|nr:hypothetical protein RCL_jg782.t1 [Rhizophagus clarus]
MFLQYVKEQLEKHFREKDVQHIDGDYNVEENERDKIISEIVKEYGPSFVKPVILNKTTKVHHVFQE